MKRLLIIPTAIISIFIWLIIVFWGTLNGWFNISIASKGDTAAFIEGITEEVDNELNGNAVVLLVEEGKVYKTVSSSIGKPVDENSIFQIASISKWVTAAGVMKLVEEGVVDLDKPVSTYLSRWKLPENQYNDSVTVRLILSHASGFNDGLGYLGFENKKDVQTLEDSLTKAADSNPDRNGIVSVGAKPGSKFMYSGGGYTLLQLLIEEVTDQSFNEYMKKNILQPLGMNSSTFILEENQFKRLADSYNKEGHIAPHRYYTALAAASLYTTASDLAKFLIAHSPGENGEPAGRGVFNPKTLNDMREPHTKIYTNYIWGLGVILYTGNNQGEYIIGHDGDNYPAIGTTVRFNPSTNDGFIVLSSGSTSFARDLGSKWLMWKTNHPGFLEILTLKTAVLFISGILIIVVLNFMIFFKKRKTYQII